MTLRFAQATGGVEYALAASATIVAADGKFGATSAGPEVELKVLHVNGSRERKA